MNLLKAVITAASPTQRTLASQRLVDCDGEEKSALQIILDEVANAGIQRVCMIIPPGDQQRLLHAAGRFGEQLVFVEQESPRGYGDALLRAKEFVGEDPFLHCVGDHLYLSRTKVRCARQLVDAARAERCSVTAVQQTRENLLPYFGAVGARRIAQRADLYEVTAVLEKPTPTQAEQHLRTAGLRTGHYLCVFGMHVLTPLALELLEKSVESAGDGERVSLAPALCELARRERYLALEIDGTRHDIGVKYGLLRAQLAHALCGRDRDLVLTELVHLLADDRHR